MDGQTYLNKWLEKRLLPFIQKHHALKNVLFWQDMASCHYKRDVVDWLNEKGIDFVNKNENAPKVPQVRPIERFWALCKAQYKRRKKKALNLRSFRIIWRNIASKVA